MRKTSLLSPLSPVLSRLETIYPNSFYKFYKFYKLTSSTSKNCFGQRSSQLIAPSLIIYSFFLELNGWKYQIGLEGCFEMRSMLVRSLEIK